MLNRRFTQDDDGRNALLSAATSVAVPRIEVWPSTGGCFFYCTPLPMTKEGEGVWLLGS